MAASDPTACSEPTASAAAHRLELHPLAGEVFEEGEAVGGVGCARVVEPGRREVVGVEPRSVHDADPTCRQRNAAASAYSFAHG